MNDTAAEDKTDFILDLLGQDGWSGHDPLTEIFAGWRDEGRRDSYRLLFDADTAIRIIAAAQGPKRSWLMLWVLGSFLLGAAMLILMAVSYL
jgi:hypothetical protein